MQFFPIFTKGIKAKLNELESESDIFPQNEGKDGKSELTPVVKALTNCALELVPTPCDGMSVSCMDGMG